MPSLVADHCVGDFIAGKFVKTSKANSRITNQSPADLSDELGIFPISLSHVDTAVQAARDAFPQWRKLEQSKRDALLRNYQQQLQTHKDAIALCICREVGKPLWEAHGEVGAMIAKVDLCLGEARKYSPNLDIDDLPGQIRNRPLGVLAVIGPYNFPGHLPNGQIVPALATGNTVIFKPSEKAPATAAWMALCLSEAGLPDGVFNVVQGEAQSAKVLVAHDGIDGILFTGSAAVGRDILTANAAHLGKLVALELGGKNASIVLEDADIDLAVRQVAFAAFATSGQRCTSTSRLIIHRSIAPAFLNKLKATISNIHVGYPQEPNVFMGPVISENSQNKILAAQTTAVAEGFEPFVPGGALALSDKRGWYLKPAVHIAPNATAAVKGYTDSELFGPDLCVFVTDTVDEAIALANATNYGLVAAVFTKNAQTFDHCAENLRMGAVHWNRSTAGASGRLPFGGIKDSGNYRPAGILVNQLCTFPQAILLNPKASSPVQWPGFPE
ncbi:MAG: aldehyde dehydrogenase family protein [Myxococcales bacterium]|nr:MAG: aldehyde dehydrogenase family protein [Myxococcales bacterium]